MNDGMTVLAHADLTRPKQVQIVRDQDGKIGLAMVEDGAWEIFVPPVAPQEARQLAEAVIMGERAALTSQHTIRTLAAHLVAALDVLYPPQVPA